MPALGTCSHRIGVHLPLTLHHNDHGWDNACGGLKPAIALDVECCRWWWLVEGDADGAGASTMKKTSSDAVGVPGVGAGGITS